MFDKPHLISAEETAESAALYCLGDFSVEERSKYEEHLSACAVCRSEVEEYSAVISGLAIADSHVLPPNARADFLTRIRSAQKTRQQRAKIESVLITAQLPNRPGRPKNREQMSAVMDQLSKSVLGTEQELLEASVHAALDLIGGGSAGFSVFYEDEQLFRWDAVAGELAGEKGGTTPRSWSPCGTTLDLGASQLFSRPARCFEYFNQAPRPIEEGLVVPVYVCGKALGTLWAASHDERTFDSEDLRALENIATVCEVAFTLMRERDGNASSDGAA